MSIIIEAPKDVYSLENNENAKLFLAGGITNCPDWQAEMIDHLKDIRDLTIFNPRRANFPINDPNASEEQITWEYNKLKESKFILFWFAQGSLNPIVLYELGRWGNSQLDKKIWIGVDPLYERKQDVEIQTRLSRYDIDIKSSIKDLANLVKNDLKYVKLS